MKEGYCPTTMTFYAVLFAEISRTAKDKGYALALHGSLSRDLDVIAVPWVDNAAPEDELVKAICDTAGGFIAAPREGRTEPEEKPHGRRAWTIHLGGCSATVSPEERATFIDLSVMPRSGNSIIPAWIEESISNAKYVYSEEPMGLECIHYIETIWDMKKGAQ